MTIVGLHDFVKVSISAESKSLLLNMCIDAPESTTNSRSWGLCFNAGRHLFSEGEKNAALLFSLNFRTLLASLHAASRAPCSCHSVSSWDPQTLEHWGYADEVHLGKSTTASVNFTRRIGFRMSELFRKIDEDFGGSISWNTQPQLSCLFQHSHCTSVTILFRPFAWLFFNLAMRIRALFPKSAIILGLVEQSFWRMPLFTEWIGASSFEVILARPSRHSTTGTLASGTSGSPRISLILPHERTLRRIRLCRFCTLIDIVTETAIVSFREHCPLVFHCQHSLKILCPRCFVTWFLTTAFVS